MKRSEALAILSRRRRDEIVLSTMMAAEEWPEYSSDQWDFVDGDAMGQATPFGLGLALAQPERRVWVFNGDGSQLMTLGSLVTVAACAPPNLVILIFRNDTYEVTGGQPIPGVDVLRFPDIALGCGIPRVYEFDDASDFEERFDEAVGGEGPVLVDLEIDGP